VLATYLRKRKLGVSWYNDELLELAKDIGTRLLPAFNTSTGIPYPRVHINDYCTSHTFMLFIFENGSSAHALGGVSGVASFITTDEQLQ